jgi:hypothetical protein
MHQQRFRSFFLSLITFLSLLLITEKSNASFPLPPRLSANGYASDFTVGQADLMLPLAGNCAHNFYLDPSLAYGSDDQGYADIGVGYRWIENNAAILGVYLFGGYSRIDNNARLWVVNPGVEALGSRWDAHLNAYFPFGDRNYALGNFVAPPLFASNTRTDNLYDWVQYVGDGADVKLAYQLFPRSTIKGYVGSYFFAPAQTSNIWGGAAGLEFWPDQNVKVFASYTYDNLRHSTGAVGLGVEFGGTHHHRRDPTVQERITDPVDRYLAELGRGSKIPSRKTSQFAGSIVTTNIAFFSETGTGPLNCTFEDPCGPSNFTQTDVNDLSTNLPDTIFYFEPGTYPTTNGSGGPLSLAEGQSLHSRTPGFGQPATGAGRSTFGGALTLTTDNVLENTILLPGSGGNVGVQANNATGVLITGSQIGSDTNPFSDTGVRFQGSSQADIINTDISAFDAVQAQNTTTLNILNSNITSTGAFSNTVKTNDTSNVTISNSLLTGTGGNTVVLQPENSSQITVTNSTLNASGNSATAIITRDTSAATIVNNAITVSGGTGLVGIVNDNGSEFTMNNSSLAVEGSGAVGLQSNDSSLIAINNSSLALSGGTDLVAVNTSTNADVTINNSTLTATGDGSTGTISRNNSRLILNNVTLAVSGDSTQGVQGRDSSVVTVNTGSTVSVTGTGDLVGFSANDESTMEGSDITINVTSTSGGSGSFALGTFGGTTRNITVNNGSSLNVSGTGAAITNGGSNITVTDSTCSIDGSSPTPC